MILLSFQANITGRITNTLKVVVKFLYPYTYIFETEVKEEPAEAAVFIASTAKAVSYTHLDVYKRQALLSYK